MPSIAKVKVDVSKCIDALRKRMATMRATSKRELSLWAESALMRVRIDRMSGRPGVRGVSGKLSRSLRHEERGRVGESLRTRLFSARSVCKYGHVHELGMTISSKGKLLAIPIRGGPALRPNGEKFFAGPAQARRKFKSVKMRDGRLFLKDLKGRFWYRLKTDVYIPKRLYFRESIRGYIGDLRSRLASSFKSELV